MKCPMTRCSISRSRGLSPGRRDAWAPHTHNSDVEVGLEIDVVEAEPSLGEPTEQTDVPSMPIPPGTTPYVSHRGPTAEIVGVVMAR